MLAEFDFRILADVDATLNGIAFVLICSGLIAGGVSAGAAGIASLLSLSSGVSGGGPGIGSGARQ